MDRIIDLSGFDRLAARFRKLAEPNCEGLMVTWENTIEADNRKGVLAGLDLDGNPLKAVTYRPKNALALSPSQRLHQKKNAKRGNFAGFGDHASGANNNLTWAEYRRLDGPPLAPRRQFSRVITNLKTDNGREGNGRWFAAGQWFDVVSPTGFAFLPELFKVRDLRGVRPAGVEIARKQAREFMIDLVRKG